MRQKPCSLTGGSDSGDLSGITLVPGGTDSGKTAGITLAIGTDFWTMPGQGR